jgi:hypothetical protein
VEAIRTVHRRWSLIQPVAIEQLLDRRGPERPAEEQGVEPLTNREAAVLQIMARGRMSALWRACFRGNNYEDWIVLPGSQFASRPRSHARLQPCSDGQRFQRSGWRI